MTGYKIPIITGEKFNNLTTIKYSHTTNNKQHAKYLCDCGNIDTYEVSKVITNVRIKCVKCTKLDGIEKRKANRHGIKVIYKTPVIPGTKFNNLTFIGYSHNNKQGDKYNNYKCDCGNNIVAKGSAVTHNVIQRCKECSIKKRTLLGEISAKHSVIKEYKLNAKNRNLDYNLTNEESIKLMEQNCHYSGHPPGNKQIYGNKKKYYLYNGIDRLDNTKGYYIENCVPCCKICNFAKRTLTKEEFLDWVKSVYEHSIKPYENKK